MTDQLLSINQVRQFVPFARSTIYARLKEGQFPAPRKIGNRNFWRMSDLQAWIKRGEE